MRLTRGRGRSLCTPVARFIPALIPTALVTLAVATSLASPSASVSAPERGSQASCADVFFLGAMGSGQREVWGPTGGYGWEVNDLRKALARELTSSGITMKASPIDYPARGTEILKPGRADINLKRYYDRVQYYFDGLSSGITEVTNRLIQASACDNQAIVLAGYSQGAMVMHRALVRLRDKGRRDILNRVMGVVLFADGDRAPNSTASRLIGDPVAGRKGRGIAQSFGWQPDIPRAVAGRTWNFCTKNDLVCDFRDLWNLNVKNNELATAVHFSYRGTRYSRTPAWHIAQDIKELFPPNVSLQDQLLAALNTARNQARWCGTSFHDARAPLVPDSRLAAAARKYAFRMANEGFVGHTSPDGTTPESRAAAEGWHLPVGENLAAGQSSAADVVTAWLASPTHCDIVMTTGSYAGAGVASSTANGYIWTLEVECTCP